MRTPKDPTADASSESTAGRVAVDSITADDGVTAEGAPIRLSDGLIPTLDGERLQEVSSQRPGQAMWTTADGTPVDNDRQDEIVFVNPESDAPDGGWWSAASFGQGVLTQLAPLHLGEPMHSVQVDDQSFSRDDVASLLATIGSSFVPAAASEPSPSSFHFRLAAFIAELDPGPPSSDGTNGLKEPSDGAEPIKDADPIEDKSSVTDQADWGYGFWKATLHGLREGPLAQQTPSGAQAFQAEVFWGEAEKPACYQYWIRSDQAGHMLGAGWLATPPPMHGAPAHFNKASAADDDDIDLSELFANPADDAFE